MTDSLAAALQQALGDSFRVGRELGGGGMSRVFLAHDLTLDRDIVVKVLSEESTSGVSAERFRREIQTIAKLQHPHVVSILSAGVAGGALYYTMPFISGETLRERIAREGALPIADTVRLLREVLDALAFAHDHGVVHRDIKPENVLIGAGHAVVADFGIAKALRESGTMTSAGYAMGTPAYMAPEQATADPTTNHRADLYAVGVLGYELLTGATPFSGSAQQMITAHLTTPAPTVRARRIDVPEPLSALIAGALEKEPDNRPQTARIMIGELDNVATPTAMTARDAAATTPAPLPVSRSRSRRGWMVGAGIAVIAAAGVYLLKSSKPPVVAAAVTRGAELIAVMPLSVVSSTDTALARLGQDLVVTLSANLDNVGSLQTVDAVTLLMRARKASSPLPLAEAMQMAEGLGARSVLNGTLTRQGDSVMAQVTLTRVNPEFELASAKVVGLARDIASLTDSITWNVLRQVWISAETRPSPVLKGLTTSKIDALRSFLDGERLFLQLDVDSALTAYRRAFEIDSNFVQAFLRYDYANDWLLNPSDSVVHSRLLALKDKLPERERLWLEMREDLSPVPQRIKKRQDLAARYPDYPPILMLAADPIIHLGPLFGIPISNALPFLESIAALVPDHADTKLHMASVRWAVESDSAASLAFAEAARASGEPIGPMLAWSAALLSAKQTGSTEPTREMEKAAVRVTVKQAAQVEFFANLTGVLGVGVMNAPLQLAAVERARTNGTYSGRLVPASAWGEGLLRISTGDWTEGMQALRRAEASQSSFVTRSTSARLAVLGAWFGAVAPASADSALARVRAVSASGAQPADLAELLWLDGVMGVIAADSARVQGARRNLQANTSPVATFAMRSLTGLWMDYRQSPGAADTLKAVSDSAITHGTFFGSIETIDRLVMARGLRKQGRANEVERYLMWTDAIVSSPRSLSVSHALAPLVSYERGVALDEAGNRSAAIHQLRKFVGAYTQPPAAHRAIVDDAKKRLAKLETTDAAPRPKTVPP